MWCRRHNAIGIYTHTAGTIPPYVSGVDYPLFGAGFFIGVSDRTLILRLCLVKTHNWDETTNA